MAETVNSKKFNSVELIDFIVDEISIVAGISKNEIDIDQGFMEMGIDSLQAVAIVENLTVKLKQPINVSLLFDYPHISALAKFLESDRSQKVSNEPKMASSTGGLSQNQVATEISIVGMSCRFPKAQNLTEFLKLLDLGVDAIHEMSESRLRRQRTFRSNEFGCLENIDQFAADAFSISDHEANNMDPQQRLLLEESYRAIEDAGISLEELRGSNTGVFIGISNSDYTIEISKTNQTDIFTALGNAHSIAANRLSYFYDLKGPSLAIDTACSSSLVALHMAVESLIRNEIDMAIVGGANLVLSPELSNAFIDATMISQDSRCFSFTNRANGYVRGEGVGVVILRRQLESDPERYRSYATIKATAVNQDGKSSGLTAPNGQAQESVMREALVKAQIDASEISFHEAHGTATPLGDPIELLALQRVHQERPMDQPLLVGSVKTNIGHLESAAGIASLIKVALGLFYKKVFANLHFDSLNEQLINRISSLKIASQSQTWHTRDGRPLYASISSFGFGGTNAHVILEQSDSFDVSDAKLSAAPATVEEIENSYAVFAWSANTPLAARAGLASLQDLISTKTWREISAIASASLATRRFFKEQILMSAENKTQLKINFDLLKQPGELGADVGSIRPFTKENKRVKRVAFLFTGQGAQYSKMYFSLYQDDKTFKSLVDKGLREAQIYFRQNLFQVWTDSNLEIELHETDYSQCLLFVLELSFANYLKQKFNLTPSYVFGHSLGEVTAAVFAGALSEVEGIQLVACRGHLMRHTDEGAMICVFDSKSNIESYLASGKIELDFAAFNGPNLTILSGIEQNISNFQKILEKLNIRSVRLRVKQAFHSKLMDPILVDFKNAVANITYRPMNMTFISSLSGQALPEGFLFTPQYWSDQIRNPTQFEQAVLNLDQLKISHYIELGPEPQLIGMAKRFSNNSNAAWIHFFDKNNSKNTFERGCLSLFQHELVVQTMDLFAPFKKAELPKTMLTKKPYWFTQQTKEMSPVANRANSIFLKSPVSQLNMALGDEVGDHTQEVLNALVQILASVMRVPVEEVSVDKNLVEIGADSLVLMSAVQQIKDFYQVVIPVSEVFKDLNTLKKIASYVVKNASCFQNSLIVEAGSRQDILELMQQQIAKLDQQLQILKSNAKSTSSKPTSLNSQRLEIQSESLSSEKRGVLGNFKKYIGTDAASATDTKKELYLEDVICQFNSKRTKTKQHVQKFRKELADNRISAGFRPSTKEMVYPIHCYKAKGSKFFDIDGNEYIDFSMGFGVNLFGHSPDFIELAIQEQLKLGMCLGPQSFLAGDVAALIGELTQLERVAFVNSGTEAVMTAVRLARAATGRSKIVIFDGSYHGHFDGILARPSKGLKSHPVAAGISESMVEDIIVLEYGSQKSLEIIENLGVSLAGVLVEPVQSRFPELQPKEFLQNLRRITEKNAVAFIWDEVITGFRIAVGGAQAHFGIQADLASYGKIVGGGMPIGVVAGSARFLDFIDGGYWDFGDDSYPSHEMTFFAGTFSKHPLAMATALAVLKELKANGPELLTDLNLKTAILCHEMNTFFEDLKIEIKMYNFGSLFRFKANLNLDLFFTLLNERGFYVWEGRNLFMSTAHTDDDIKKFKKVIKEITRELLSTGILDSRNDSNIPTYPFTVSQNRFLALHQIADFGTSAGMICVSAKIKGFLDILILRQALEKLIESRDLFRIKVDLENGQQYFSNLPPPVNFEFVSFRKEKTPWKILDQELNALAQSQKTLLDSSGLLVRLYDVAVETHVIAVLTNHLIYDGWTMTLFFDELARLYNCLLSGATPKFDEYLGYQHFLNLNKTDSDLKRLRSSQKYWESEFSSLIENNQKQAPVRHKNLKGQRIVFDLELKIYEALKLFSKNQKMTPFMFLLGCFAKTLMAKLNKNEIVIGIPVANRDYLGSEKMFGNCANLLAVKIQSDGESYEEYFAHVKEKIVSSYQNMNYPYEDLILKTGPIFDTYFNLEPTSDLPEFDRASLIIHPFPIAAAEFKLMLNITDFEFYYHCEFDFQLSKITDDEVLVLINDLKKQIKEIVVPKTTLAPLKPEPFVD